MIIQTLEKQYTVINHVFSDDNVERYICKEETGSQRYAVTCIKNRRWIRKTTGFLMQQMQNRYFTDYVSCFFSEECLYVVMNHVEGISLKKKLEDENCYLRERMLIGKNILEKIMILSMPDYFLQDCMKPETVMLSPALEVNFRYELSQISDYDKFHFLQVQNRLGNLFETLFFRELKKGMLPPGKSFCNSLREGKYQDIPEMYAAYDSMCKAAKELSPEEDVLPKTWSFRLWDRIKKCFVPLRKKPDSLKEYYLVGKHYIAKKIVYLAAFLLVIGMAFFIIVGLPWMQAKFFTKTFVINSEKMQGYTGRVRLVDNRTDGNLLFAGYMEEGRINGQGTLYDYEGNKIYQGNFLMEMYEGKGETFYSDGQTCYKGEFAANKYEGKGILYYRNGQVQYEGQFIQNLFEGQGTGYFENGSESYMGEYARGMYNGNGQLFYSDGTLKYMGEFKDNEFSGRGNLYSEEGQLVYEGEFEAGKKNGEGTLYEEGEVIYSGTFKEDEMAEGSIILYDKRGRIKYSGGIRDGKYQGSGKLYRAGKLLYDGMFHEGRYEGKGKLYGKKGKIIYKGDFLAGTYEGKGVFYEGGKKRYKGEFLQGQYEGKGKLYGDNKELVYSGEFAAGFCEGKGKEYEEGRLVYDGSYVENRYEGKGKLFDSANGNLVYDGEFYQGQYEGEGRLYDSADEILVYDGTFHLGQYEGEGKLYDKNGILRYEGGFLKGKYSGNGILYDTSTGQVKKETVFIDGKGQ